MTQVKIQDVFRKLRERQGVLTEEETDALFAHLDSLSTRIGRLETRLSEALQHDSKVTSLSGSKRTNGKKELMEEYGLLYEALRHARPTNYTDGEAHLIYLNQMAALAADTAALYEMGVAISSPLRLNDEEGEDDDEANRDRVTAWSEIIQNGLLSNKTMVVLTANDPDEQKKAKASFGAVLESMKRGELGNVPLPKEVIEMEGIAPWSEKPSRALFHHLLESMGIETIQRALKQGVREHPNTGIFSRISGSDFLGSILARISSPSIYDIFDIKKTKMNSLELVLAYLGDGCSQAELRRLELSRNLTVEDRFLLLAAILQFRIGTKFTSDHQEHARFWLWLDRLENVLHYTPKEQRDFTNGLNTLAETMPIMFTLCLNISDPSAQAKVMQTLGPRFVERVDYNLIGVPDGKED